MNAEQFKQWAKSRNIQVFDKLENFMINQKVTYTNEYGVSFEDKTIIGFSSPNSYGGCVFLDKDSYWFPVKLSQIK
ncbi:MAG: hypothetical protein GXX85_00865 [Ignavibacteria bacterium]|nr:hypothetical protein [Ignavibacteria bacterium]